MFFGFRSGTAVNRDIALQSESRGSGDPLVMIHGFGATRYTFRYLMEPFSRTHRAVAVDLKGFGDSPKPLDNAYSVNDQVDLMERFIQSENMDAITLCGHSYGGAVALRLALRFMDRQPALIRRLIIIAGAAYPQPLPPHMNFLKMPGIARLGLGIVSPENQVKLVLESCYYDKSKITEDMIRAYAEPMKSPGSRHAMVQIVKELSREKDRSFDLDYRRIRIPALLIWGRHDKIVPLSVGEKLHEELPDSRLEILENCGHVPPEECPEAVISLIREFLDDRS